MSAPTAIEPLRDRIGRAIYEEDSDHDWYALSEDRREPWRSDADRVIAMLIREGSMTAIGPWFGTFIHPAS